MFLLILAIAACGVAADAHHSLSAAYDSSRSITIEGRLISFFFRSPHSAAIVEAPDENGEMQRWNVAWSASRQLSAQGITREFFKPGDHLVITGNPGRNAASNTVVMRSLFRPSDGFEWGNREGEVVD
jgi:hypothetical protein